MKILIDIGHPAHVHYFRNFIKIMKMKGHEFLITARDKEISQQLLNEYNIKYVSRGKGGNSFLGKALYLLKGDFLLFKHSLRFKPDIFMSFASPYAAQVSKLIGKPHIAFDDTEHAKWGHMMYVPFTNCIFTPYSFNKNFKSKQIRFYGTMDNSYLHPSVFEVETDYIKELGLLGKKFFVLRFVNWGASHDKGHNGFSSSGINKLVNMLKDYGNIIISSEKPLSSDLEDLRYKGRIDKIHSLLSEAEMFIGESGSMATEAAILGTPSLVVNSSAKLFGVFKFLKKIGNLFYYDNENDAFEKINELLKTVDLKKDSIIKKEYYFKNTINLTDFMVWFIETYPESVRIMKDNPDYQNRFK